MEFYSQGVRFGQYLVNGKSPCRVFQGDLYASEGCPRELIENVAMYVDDAVATGLSNVIPERTQYVIINYDSGLYGIAPVPGDLIEWLQRKYECPLEDVLTNFAPGTAPWDDPGWQLSEWDENDPGCPDTEGFFTVYYDWGTEEL